MAHLCNSYTRRKGDAAGASGEARRLSRLGRERGSPINSLKERAKDYLGIDLISGESSASRAKKDEEER